MPMIDVYATAGTFANKHDLAQALAAAMMRWEQVPDISFFRDNTAAFIHDLGPDALANATGDSNYVRVQILTPIGVLNRDKQLGVVKEMTDIVASAADGAAVYKTLTSKATALRATALAVDKARANERSEKLVLPVALLAVGFLLLVLYPAAFLLVR